MGERKVLNRYFPPDFDPAKVPRPRRSQQQPKNDRQMKVRMMLPMSIRCKTCGAYISKGTKFNSRKEDVGGEEETKYLGVIQIFRFYFKCTNCSSEITFKTDPRNSDYVVESGAARNFEPWRRKEEEEEGRKRKEEMGDALQSLQNRAADSKRDIDVLAALEETRSIKSRHAAVTVEEMLEQLKRSDYGRNDHQRVVVGEEIRYYVRRIPDDDDDEDEDQALTKAASTFKKGASSLGDPSTSVLMPKFITKPAKKPRREPAQNDKDALLSLCQNYDTDQSD